MTETYDLIVIGAGPGGYVAAIRARQLGMTVAVVEKRATLGGVCLNEGCIPSKALLDSSELFVQIRDKAAGHGILVEPPRLELARMQERKREVVGKLTDGIAFLFKKNGITRLTGSASLAGVGSDGLVTVGIAGDDQTQPARLQGRRVLLATGSSAVALPGIPFDGHRVVDASGALAFKQVPEHLLVVGAGYIGLELGSVWRRLGARVTVVETLAKPLPATDGQVADALVRSLKKQGFSFRMETRVTALNQQDEGLTVELAGPSGSEQLTCDRLLVAAGRRPVTAGLGLEQVGLAVGADGRLAVDDQYATSVPGIFAIGDLVAGPMLAHKASEEGVVCVERMAGQASRVAYECLPGVVYTWPEAAGVGQTEEQLKASGRPYLTGRFNFSANGRARCMDEGEGFVKLLADAETGRIEGVHIIGPRASDLIAEAVTAMTYGATAQDLAMTFHGHPTLAEALKEAALDAHKQAIHA